MSSVLRYIFRMKDARLQMRAETAEKLVFERCARRKGMTLSDWLRIAGREQAAQELGETPERLFNGERESAA